MSQIRGEIQLSLIGGYRLERGGTRLEPTERGRRLLAALALFGPTSRSHAAALLWPDADEARSLGSLRTVVWRLRRVEPDLLESTDDHLRLGSRVQVDVSVFAARAVRLLQADRVEDGDLDRSVLPAGELLPGWDDDWTRFERERLRQLRLHALEMQARLLCDRGRITEAVASATKAIRLAPLRESAHQVLIEILLARRDAAEARQCYARFHRVLGAELGVAPSARLRELVRQGA